ncbi:MAG: hypothetical protein HYS27_07845 [Deltaproteobacteria bacterium]|nr:hypothetical protein [Deltaproteobacteria bacterium]
MTPSPQREQRYRHTSAGKNAMHRPTLALLVFASLLSLGLYTAEDFNARGRRHQPPPSPELVDQGGVLVGADNGVGEGMHYAGEDCAVCHTPGGKAGRYVFSIAGTIYEDRFARRPAVGARVMLEDVEGNILTLTTNSVGNYWTTTPIASNPLAVANHGGATTVLYTTNPDGSITPADPSDSRTWQYKAWISHDGATRHMVTIAPVGGATGTTPRMSCTMHHAGMGSSGASWVSSRQVFPNPPASNISFKKHVLPVLSSRCVPCHIPGNRMTRAATSTDIDPLDPTTVDYSDGKDFTSYDGSTVDGVSKDGFRDFVDPGAPDLSEALLKTRKRSDGTVAHAGGGFFDPEDADYRVLLQWVTEGALDN